jgi:hypothetical protein
MLLLAGILAALPLTSAFQDTIPLKDVVDINTRDIDARRAKLCHARGFARTRPYFFRRSRRLASVDACGSHCLEQRQCVSFAVGRGACLHYNVAP